MPNVSLATFARYVQDAAEGFRPARHDGLDDAGRRIAARAKGYIGHYQSSRIGPFGPWPPLAESTVEQKIALGYAPPDSPLLRTGDLRDSITHEVRGASVFVGSPDRVARYQEFGTVSIPPRAFIGRAMAELGPREGRRVAGHILWPLLRRSVR